MTSNLACWCILTTFRTEKIFVAVCWYSSFWRHFGATGIFFTTHGSNGLKFDMLMNADHFWSWLHLGHGLLGFFLILAPFWFSETCQIWGFLRAQGRNGLKLSMLVYSDHLQNRLYFGHSLFIFLILASFWHSETGHIWGFRDFL